MGVSADFNDGLVLLIVKMAFEYWQWINKKMSDFGQGLLLMRHVFYSQD